MWLFVRDGSAHAEFIAPARGRAEPWRLMMGLVLIAGLYLWLSQMVFDWLFSAMPPETADGLAAEINSGSSVRGMYILLLQFGLLAVATAIVTRMLHQRSVATLLGPMPRFLRQFFGVLVLLVMLTAALWVLPPWNMGEPYGRGLPPGLWLLLLPISVCAVLVQAGTEELVFRGYLQQQLAARFRSPLIWMVVPSALFATGHYLPGMAGDNALPIAIWAGMFGILMADLTARAGSLGPAIAVHLVNNVSALLITALPDEMSGLALFIAPFGMSDEAALAAWLPVDFGIMVVCWLAARLAIRR